MTFDWAQIAYIGSPLVTPWWAAANVVGGLVILMWIVAPILCEGALLRIIGWQLLIDLRLQERTLLFVHAYYLVRCIRRYWQAVRRQQNPHKRLPLQSRGLHSIQQGVPAHYLCLGLRYSIRRHLGPHHAYSVLAWPRHMADVQGVAQRRHR